MGRIKTDGDNVNIILRNAQITDDEISMIFRKDPLPTRYYYKDTNGQYKYTTSFIR